MNFNHRRVERFLINDSTVVCSIDFFVSSGNRFESLDSHGFTAYLSVYFNRNSLSRLETVVLNPAFN